MNRCKSCMGRGFKPRKRKPTKRNPNALGFYAATCRTCGGSGIAPNQPKPNEPQS